MEGRINQSGYFPELRLAELQRHAERWAGKYANVIQRICLYNYTPKRLAAYKEIWLGFAVRYALVFELLSDADSKSLKDLETATEQHETVHRGYPALFDNRFFTVYTDKPEDDYPKHWVVFLKEAGKEMQLGVMMDEPYWVLYGSCERGEDDRSRYSTPTRGHVSYKDLSVELFPELNPLEFTRRAREWIEKWPLIDDVRLYAGMGERLRVVLFTTRFKELVNDSDFWTDSLTPLQQNLKSIYKDSKDFDISKWQLLTLGVDEDLPAESIHPDNSWAFFKTDDETLQKQDDKSIATQADEGELADEKVLWIIYSDATREVWLNDCYGQKKLLSKPHFDGINDNLFAFLYGNTRYKMTTSDLLSHDIDLNNKPLHKVIDELGFKGKLKRLFFKVSKATIIFNSSVTRKGLKEANIPDSKEELYRLFFM